MRPTDLAPVAWLVDASPGDPVFDALMVLGPAVLAVVALAGRTTATTALVGLYLASSVVYVVYNGVRR